MTTEILTNIDTDYVRYSIKRGSWSEGGEVSRKQEEKGGQNSLHENCQSGASERIWCGQVSEISWFILGGELNTNSYTNMNHELTVILYKINISEKAWETFFYICVVGELTMIRVCWTSCGVWTNKCLEGPRVCSFSSNTLHQVISLINSTSQAGAAAPGWNIKLQSLDHKWHVVGQHSCRLIWVLREWCEAGGQGNSVAWTQKDEEGVRWDDTTTNIMS